MSKNLIEIGELESANLPLKKWDAVNFLELGLHYLEHHPKPIECQRALALIRRAADAGYRPASLALGEIYRLESPNRRCPWKAIGWWGKSIRPSLLTHSQTELSDALANDEQGLAIPPQFSSSDVNHLLYAIASHYRREDFFNGKHLPDRMLKSFGYQAGRTCNSILWDSGNLSACYYLGLIYLQGKGVVPNAKKGIALLQIAADRGHQKAIVALAACFTCGLFGAGFNRKRGRELMTLALQSPTNAGPAQEVISQPSAHTKSNAND